MVKARRAVLGVQQTLPKYRGRQWRTLGAHGEEALAATPQLVLHPLAAPAEGVLKREHTTIYRGGPLPRVGFSDAATLPRPCPREKQASCLQLLLLAVGRAREQMPGNAARGAARTNCAPLHVRLSVEPFVLVVLLLCPAGVLRASAARPSGPILPDKMLG